MKFLVFLLASWGLVACDQKSSTDSTKERAAAEGEANNGVDNANQAQKAQKMEKDLSERHYFYNALEGEYQGTVEANTEIYNIKFIFARSLPPYTGDRVRQLSEIENDLNNLFFTVQIVQWHASDIATSVACPASGIRPNIANGTLVVTSLECPNMYTIFLAENLQAALEDRVKEAKLTAEKLKQQQIDAVSLLTGAIQSNANKYTFSVKKLK